MANRRLIFRTGPFVRQVAAVVAVVVAVALVGPPTVARAAVGTINTSAQGVRATIRLLSAVNVPVTTHQSVWQTGQPADTLQTAGVDARVPVVGTNLLGTGAVTSTAGPVTGGGSAEAKVLGLNLLGAGTVGADAITTRCQMTASALTGGTETANLDVAGNPVEPGANADVDAAGITGKADAETAVYDSSTGRLTYTVRGLDLTLSSGGVVGAVASGTVVVAESVCSGIVRLGAVTTGAKSIVPGNADTPTVTVTNTGDVAVPNTTITVPAPPAGYTVTNPTTTGGGTCTVGGSAITCTGVTVPGGGSVTVSLPTRIASSAVSAANWQPATNTVTAVATPVAAVPATTLTVRGAGRLVTVLPPATNGGTITVTPVTVAAGRSASTPITVANQGPSDATTTVTVPIANRPAGVSVVSAAVGGNACTVAADTVTCSGVTVPSGGTATVSVRVAATTVTPPGTTWALAGVAATLNGTSITGGGPFVTVSDPDVNLTGGVSITPATATPGGSPVTPAVRVANVGIVAATDTVITLPAPPTGYAVGAVTTSNGTGTCATGPAGVRCTGVTVPANGAVVVSVPVTLNSAVTAHWTSVASGPVTATSGDSTGQVTGRIVTADPEWTLGITTEGPAPNTVAPGGNTTLTVTVADNGPSDAVDDSFVVVAPTSTTYGSPLTGDALAYCRQLSPTTMRCTLSLPADADPVVLAFPLKVSADADPRTPLGGGCVSLNDDTDCADPDDEPIDPIYLRTPLGRRLTVTPAAATIVPGTSGDGRVRLTSSSDEQDLTVTVPLAQLPTGFTVIDAGSDTGSCSLNTTRVRCTGVDLTAGEPEDITVDVALASSVLPPATWTATGVTVADGTETTGTDGALAIADDPQWDVTATITGPPDDTVLPGGTARLTVVAHNEGPSDATDATFVVTAPASTTIEPLTGDANTYCRLTSTTRAVCTADLVDDAYTPELYFVLDVAGNADPDVELDGGCVDLDGDPGCGPDDVRLRPIRLKVPFDRTAGIVTTQATVTPGLTGDATVGVVSRRGALTGLTVTVPLGGLPPRVTVAGVTAPAGATCTPSSTQIRCTGVDVAAGGTTSITLRVSATSAATPGATWTATGITVARGSDQITGSGRLALVGPRRYVLRPVVTPPADPIPPGGTDDITVDVNNDGPSDTDDVTINVLGPRGGTFGDPVAPTSTSCRKTAPNRISCTFRVPAGGTPPQFKLPFRVDDTTDPADSPLDGGCVDLDGDYVCDGDDPGLPGIPVATPFDRKLTISTIPSTVPVGVAGVARVRLSPTEALNDLTVTVPLTGKPAQIAVTGLVLGPLGSSCTVGTAIVCTGVDVPATGTTISIPVLVAADAPIGLSWYGRAIRAEDGDGGVAIGAGYLVRTGAATFTLTGTVTGPADDTVLPGDTAEFAVTVRNQGPSPADDALVTLQAPVGTTFGELRGTIAGACEPLSATRLGCLVTLASGDSLTWTLPVRVPANADPSVAVSGGCLDLDGDGVCDYDDGDVPLPDLRLAVDLGRGVSLSADNPSITPGTVGNGTVSFASSVSRTGVSARFDAAGLPDGVTVTGASVEGQNRYCVIYPDGDIGCTNFTVTAGETTDVVLTFTVDPDATEGDYWRPAVTMTRGAESVTRSLRVMTVGEPVHPLTVEVVPPGPGTVPPGGTGGLDITVTNEGPSRYRDAVVEFEAPPGTTFLPPEAPLSDSCRRTTPTHVVCEFDLPVIAKRFVLRISVPPTADPDEEVDGGCYDVDQDGRCTFPPDQPLPPIVLGTPFSGQVELDTDTGTATPGTSGTGYVVIDADRDLDDLTVTVPKDTVPAGFTVTGVAGPTGANCVNGTTEIRCTGVTAAEGRTRVVTITVATAASLPRNVTWTAYAIAVDDESGDSVQTNGALLRTTDPIAPITYTVPGVTGTVRAGATVTLTVVVHNDGPSDATNVTTKIVAPNQTTFGGLSGQVAANCTKASSTLLTCRFGQPADAEDLTWTIPLLIAGTASLDNPPNGGCVSVNDDTDCDDPDDVGIGGYAINRRLSEIATLNYNAVTVAPGDSGVAEIVLGTSTDLEDLVLTVPLNLPGTFTVTDVESDSGDCTATTEALTCTGITLTSDTPVSVRITVEVDPSASPTQRWRATGVKLAFGDDRDSFTSSGLLASTSPADYDVTVTVGRPTVNPAAPRQTTVVPVTLHNNGPSDARPYSLVLLLPAGLSHGNLPDGCVEGTGSRIVVCDVDLAAGDDVVLRFPMVVGANVAIGTVLTPCLDAVGETTFNYTCGDPDDTDLDGIEVVSSKVDLSIRYLNPSPRAAKGGTVRIGLPYSNNGTETAADVTFTIDPPDGVTVTAADILLDAAGADAAVGGTGPGPDETVAAECESSPTGDENTVVCDGPEAPVGESSQLWLRLYVASSVPTGTYPITVQISTTSPEGNVVNNFATAQLAVVNSIDEPEDPDDPDPQTPRPNPEPGAPDDNSNLQPGGDLPRTGQDVIGLLVLSVMLVMAGVTARIVARAKPQRRPGDTTGGTV